MLKKLYLSCAIAFIATTFLLVGCSSSWRYARPVPFNRAALIQEIKANDVQVVQVGDAITFSLPADRFFAINTPVLNRNYYPVLNQIATLLRSFDKYTVKVSGYTDNRGWPLRNVALSRAQALAVANYLWAQKVDARLMSSAGYGDATPIANNNTDTGRAMNRRIEISLRMIAEPDDM
jgi:outer membrane protein OmpA-like peptidoglycan-associated protein